MKKHYLLFLAFSWMFVCFNLKAQTVNTTAEVFWKFDLGTAGQTATYSEGTADYFRQDYVTFGSNLAVRTMSQSSVNYTGFQPGAQHNAVVGEEDNISFVMSTKTGLTFTPTSVSFKCMRFGTDGGRVDALWKSSDGTVTSLQKEIWPNRNNDAAGASVVDITLPETIGASSGECMLILQLYSLGNTKQAAFVDVKVVGKVAGELVNVTTYNVTTAISLEGAGSVDNVPAGTVFDENSEVVLTATKNFGYKFLHWKNNAESILSTDNPYKHKVVSDDVITAVFESINTYELAVSMEGGAKDYMVSFSPEPTVIDGKKMYEEGTKVKLTAANRPILNFTNWSTGETSAEIDVDMIENKAITAAYSSVDYVAAWDFHNTGGNGRTADFFSTSENQAATLILRTESGTTNSWLDKSTVAADGYEGRPGAVCWKPLADKYYFQISFNAAEFENISVRSALLYNYNAYSKFSLEYSLDNVAFEKVGEFTLVNAKTWYDSTFVLPTAANHAPVVYVRWMPDYSSPLVGAEAVNNDGTALSGIYVFGEKAYINDGTPPVLESSVPANNATGASATGKIVLTFDEKVQIAEGTTATLSGGDSNIILEPVISGKTITFAYVGLKYNVSYTFSLVANTVSDLGNNALVTPVTINFTTMDRPTVAKKVFDFVVGVDGDFKAALDAASKAGGKRFYIFFPDGEYNIGELTGDSNQMTTISTGNLSLVGQSPDNTVIYNNSSKQEGISVSATVHFASGSKNNYLQDLSLLNKADYRTGVLTGRHVVLQDRGDKSIYKNIKLLSNQDTYYTNNNGRTYLENCDIHGTVDFICGGGDVFFNECLIYLEERGGNCISAPATGGDWGYVFSNCTIDGFPVNNNGYRLGRPWSNAPKAVYINTTMNVLPVAAGWGDPMNVVPAVFAEYNSMASAGAPVDLSNRRTTYTKDAVTVTLNPVLSKEQADNYTIKNVLGGSDDWQPQLYTEQALAPEISYVTSDVPEVTGTLSWADNDYVLCWAVFKDEKFVKFTTENHYDIGMGEASGFYTVRAANEMGGLGRKSNAYAYGSTVSVENTTIDAQPVEQKYYTVDGKQLYSVENYRGVVIVRSIYSDGSVSTKKIVNLK